MSKQIKFNYIKKLFQYRYFHLNEAAAMQISSQISPCGWDSCGMSTFTFLNNSYFVKWLRNATFSTSIKMIFLLLLLWGFALFSFVAFWEISRSTELPFIIILNFVIYTQNPLGMSSCILTILCLQSSKL